jgi:2-amino-4-hydroxy-6-hydroxymethyldihydropteridine diphosphokinase
MSVGEDAFIGLGSNLGDRVAELDHAFAEIAGLPETTLVARSSYYQSAPLDAPGEDYVNAVAHVRTSLAPIALLHALHGIEHEHGRARPFPNAPRTLDLDLLLHGVRTMETPELELPHPRLADRAFVIAPGLIVPGRGRVEALCAAVATQRLAKLKR